MNVVNYTILIIKEVILIKELGIEYICKKLKVNYSDLAAEMNVTKQNISAWTSGRREIPEKHLSYLESKFKVSREYIKKYLTTVDELEIDKQIYINQHLNEQKEVTRDFGNGQISVSKIFPAEVQKKINKMEDNINTEKVKLLFDNIINSGNNDRKFIINLLEIFARIIDNPYVNKDNLHAVLTGFCLYYGLEQGYDSRYLTAQTKVILRQAEEQNMDEIVLNNIEETKKRLGEQAINNDDVKAQAIMKFMLKLDPIGFAEKLKKLSESNEDEAHSKEIK